MTAPQILLLSLLGLLVLLVAIVLIRTLRFRPKKQAVRQVEPVSFDGDRAVETLQTLVRFPTVSYRPPKKEDEAAFAGLRAALPTLFPHVFAVCTVTDLPDRGLLLHWKGREEGDVSVMMAHYDVVPVWEEGWEKPPFDGIIEDGVIWGRGVIDTKGTLNAALFAAEELISSGFVPERDIYFAFGGDEEINGDGAPSIVRLFVERGISPGIVLDEGGAVVSDLFPGVKQSCAVVGISEKGMINVEYSITGGGGHSSAPAPHTPVGELSAACVRLEKSPFKFRLTAPTLKMFDTVGRYSSFGYRIIFANLWLFAPILDIITRKSGGQLNAIARTTVAFTQMEGSKGINVIPPYARMVSNSRIIPGETAEDVLSRIKRTVANEKISIRMINGMDPSPISVTEGEGWERLKSAIGETWQGTVVSPYLMTACSDARHWSRISDKVYRFSPFALTKEENATVHGNNERLSLDAVGKCVEFYIRLIKRS